jgi:hypothetical protein
VKNDDFRPGWDGSWAVKRALQLARQMVFAETSSILQVLTVFILVAPLGARADTLFGNLPASDGNSGGFSISTKADNTFGQAVEFTPLQDVSFDSVTLWLNGFTGRGLYSGQIGVNLSLNLMTDGSSYSPPLPPSGPAEVMATAYAPPNDGSDAAFTFDLSGSLQANTPYWLFAYLCTTGVDPMDAYNCYWDNAGATAGDVDINGSAYFEDGSFGALQSGAPAFALISVVPEPSSTAIAGAMLLIPLGLRALRRMRKP